MGLQSSYMYLRLHFHTYKQPKRGPTEVNYSKVEVNELLWQRVLLGKDKADISSSEDNHSFHFSKYKWGTDSRNGIRGNKIKSEPASTAKPKTDGELRDIICSRWSLSATREGFSEERAYHSSPHWSHKQERPGTVCCQSKHIIYLLCRCERSTETLFDFTVVAWDPETPSMK